MSWVNTYVDNYYDWLKENTVIQEGQSTEWYMISTPFIGAFNDTVEIYAKMTKDNKVVLSDNGETLDNLELQGFNIQGSKKRKYILDSILHNYGIHYSNDELMIETNHEKFSQSKHNFISAILEINDLYVLSKNKVTSIFKEDVRSYLDELDLVYTADFISKGETGLEFNFDFQIAQKSKEIVIKSFNTVDKTHLGSFLFSWNDIQPVRQRASKKEVNAIAFLNDKDKIIKPELIDAFRSKHADVILWSERHSEKSTRLLVA